MRHEDVAVGLVGDDGVGVAGGRDHLYRLGHLAVLADRADAHQVAAVGRAEQVAAGLVDVNVREALRERRGGELLQRAGLAVDGVGDHRKGLGAHRGIEEALVRADAHRHHHLPRVEARAGLQRAVELQRVHADVPVLGVRDVDESCRLRGACERHER